MVIIGSARRDERGKYTGGAAGDQDGIEVSTQEFYISSKGWYVLRPKNTDIAAKIAEAMKIACANNNIGYDQNERLGVIKYGVKAYCKTEADCSSLVRACCIYAGFDPGDFYTGNEVAVLEKTGQFETHISYNSKTVLYTGDILVTKTKGHTVVVVDGTPRATKAVFYTQAQFIKDVQKAVGVTADGIVGPKTLGALITVSAKTNKNHAVVTPLERRFKELGLYSGSIEADSGKTPCFGAGMTAAVKAYQKNVVKATVSNQDGIISKNGATWKKMLGVN